MNYDKVIDKIVSVWTFDKRQSKAEDKRALKYAIRIIWPDLAKLLDELCIMTSPAEDDIIK